jgi:hypothetical protein
MFCLGLRDLDIQGNIPTRAHITFDISGDSYPAIGTKRAKTMNGGLNVFKRFDIPILAPYNREFCPVLEVYA